MASLKKIATELNWDLSKREAYGKHNGFDVTLIQNFSAMNSTNNFKLLHVTYEHATQEQVAQLEAFVKTNKKELRFFAYEIRNNMVAARVNEGFKGLNAESLKTVLDLLLEGFSSSGLTPKVNCVYCGNDSTDTDTYINKVKFPAHESCKQSAIGIQKQRREEVNEGEGNVALGLIGAILGALVGSIPWALGVYAGWFVAPLAAITGFCSYEGYKLLGGKYKTYLVYVIPVVSLLAILVSDYILITIQAAELNMNWDQLMSIQNNREIVYQTVGMSVLFGIFGLIYIFNKIKQDGQVEEIS